MDNRRAIDINQDQIRDQATARMSPETLSLRDSGLTLLFDELDVHDRKSLIGYLDRNNLIDGSGVLVIPSSRHYYYDVDEMRGIKTIIVLRMLNHIRELKDFLRQMTTLMPHSGNFIGCFIDSKSQGNQGEEGHNLPRHLAGREEAYENGIESRIPFINRMYSIMDLKTNRNLTRRSVAGMISENGLDLVNMTDLRGVVYFHARKSTASL